MTGKRKESFDGENKIKEHALLIKDDKKLIKKLKSEQRTLLVKIFEGKLKGPLDSKTKKQVKDLEGKLTKIEEEPKRKSNLFTFFSRHYKNKHGRISSSEMMLKLNEFDKKKEPESSDSSSSTLQEPITLEAFLESLEKSTIASIPTELERNEEAVKALILKFPHAFPVAFAFRGNKEFIENLFKITHDTPYEKTTVGNYFIEQSWLNENEKKEIKESINPASIPLSLSQALGLVTTQQPMPNDLSSESSSQESSESEVDIPQVRENFLNELKMAKQPFQLPIELQNDKEALGEFLYKFPHSLAAYPQLKGDKEFIKQLFKRTGNSLYFRLCELSKDIQKKIREEVFIEKLLSQIYHDEVSAPILENKDLYYQDNEEVVERCCEKDVNEFFHASLRIKGNSEFIIHLLKNRQIQDRRAIIELSLLDDDGKQKAQTILADEDLFGTIRPTQLDN